jgi:transposase
VEVVSRDRATSYADAAKRSAPQAQQVADRFHLLKNLRERLKAVIDCRQASLPMMEASKEEGLPRVQATPADQSAISLSLEQPSKLPRLPSRLRGSPPQPAIEQRKQERRARRLARYETMLALHQQGNSNQTIAQKLGIRARTVSRALAAESYPELNPWPKRGSLLDPYKPYLLHQLQQGPRQGKHLYQEIRAQGYAGSYSQLKLFLASLRRTLYERSQTEAPADGLVLNGSEAPISTPIRRSRRMSAARASWLLVSRPENLTESQQTQLERIRAAHPDWEAAYHLAQSFVALLAQRRPESLEDWLGRAEDSGIVPLQGFARSLRQDYAAVVAACSLPWSQGKSKVKSIV